MANKKTETTEIVETENTEMAPVVNIDDVMSANGNWINTMNLSTFEGKAATINALNSALSLKDAKDTVLDICDCVTTSGMRKSRDPRVPDTECQNTYLIDTTGNAWFTQSDGIARSVRMIAMMFPDFGKNTPDGCLHLKVQANELPNGNTIKSLVLDM